MSRQPEHRRVIARNKRARHLYEILGELECGVVLVGTEVKSLREGHCSIAEALPSSTDIATRLSCCCVLGASMH